ncbi:MULTISPECIES: LLM class flavin-dependent oxidoreductase [unclassified Bradyrhizobium]
MSKKQMKLGLLLEGSGRSNAEWRHPAMPRNAGTHFGRHKELTLLAEQGKFDVAFLPDTLYVTPQVSHSYVNRFEAVTGMAALAAVTSRIGLVATVSTTYSEPFNVARQILSIDHISDGRAGWNLVTGDPQGEAENFGPAKLVSHEERYRMAEEFLQVVEGLWDSFEDDALVQDKEKNIFLDPTKLHTLNHHGQFFNVKGPINARRSVQGRPVVFTATSSESGKSFSGRCVNGVFTIGDIAQNQALTRDIKSAAKLAGRDPSQVLIMAGIRPVIADTMEEAEAIDLETRRLIGHEGAFRFLRRYFLHYDLSRHGLDEPFPADLAGKTEGYQGDVGRMIKIAEEEKLTVRQFVERFGYPKTGWVGTPERIADELQKWFENGACDGFMVGEFLPGQLRNFVEKVVPILQERGLSRKEYEGSTLREHLGLHRPENMFVRR